MKASALIVQSATLCTFQWLASGLAIPQIQDATGFGTTGILNSGGSSQPSTIGFNEGGLLPSTANPSAPNSQFVTDTSAVLSTGNTVTSTDPPAEESLEQVQKILDNLSENPSPEENAKAQEAVVDGLKSADQDAYATLLKADEISEKQDQFSMDVVFKGPRGTFKTYLNQLPRTEQNTLANVGVCQQTTLEWVDPTPNAKIDLNLGPTFNEGTGAEFYSDTNCTNPITAANGPQFPATSTNFQQGLQVPVSYKILNRTPGELLGLTPNKDGTLSEPVPGGIGPPPGPESANSEIIPITGAESAEELSQLTNTLDQGQQSSTQDGSQLGNSGTVQPTQSQQLGTEAGIQPESSETVQPTQGQQSDAEYGIQSENTETGLPAEAAASAQGPGVLTDSTTFNPSQINNVGSVLP